MSVFKPIWFSWMCYDIVPPFQSVRPSFRLSDFLFPRVAARWFEIMRLISLLFAVQQPLWRHFIYVVYITTCNWNVVLDHELLSGSEVVHTDEQIHFFKKWRWRFILILHVTTCKVKAVWDNGLISAEGNATASRCASLLHFNVSPINHDLNFHLNTLWSLCV